MCKTGKGLNEENVRLLRRKRRKENETDDGVCIYCVIDELPVVYIGRGKGNV